MGVDKATLAVGDQAGSRGSTLAVRTARLLGEVTDIAVEVGPGRSGLPYSTEDPPGDGPLAGFAEGWRRLRSVGWEGPVLLVATDLPSLDVEFLRWLAGYPGDRSVVPTVGRVPQPLCARYAPGVFDRAVDALGRGDRSMRALLEIILPILVDPETAGAPDSWRDSLADADTPGDLARLAGAATDRAAGVGGFANPRPGVA